MFEALKKKYSPKYILRFDDLHERMNWKIWDQIELLLDEHSIKPIVAVIPKNKNERLNFSQSNLSAQSRYREMHLKGYEVSMHGFDHVFITQNSGLFGFTDKSEFAGLNRDQQQKKISQGIGVFREFGVNPRCWVGPNHSYDFNTIKILEEFGFTIVSDGLHRFPYMLNKKIMLIPQQKWKLNAKLPAIITVCYHHNNWDMEMLSKFKADVLRNLSNIVTVDFILKKYQGRRKTTSDFVFSKIDRFVNHNVKESLAKIMKI